MSKLKSHSGAKKRIRRTGSGKLAFNKKNRRHLLLQKKRRAKRENGMRIMHPTNERAISLLVPHL